MARVFANNAEYVLPLDDAARFTLPLDGCSNFHESVSVDEIGCILRTDLEDKKSPAAPRFSARAPGA